MGARRGPEDVDGNPPDGGVVLGRVILASATGILVEQDVEHPMEAVLDAPVGSHDVEECLGREQARGD